MSAAGTPTLTRVALDHGPVTDAEPVGDSGPEAFDHHIATLGESQDDIRTVRFLEIHDDAAFVAIHPEECCGDTAHERRAEHPAPFTTGRFDFENVGPHIAECHGAGRSGRPLR
jgi:hypothetical protein